ncbi:MAG: 2-oxoacid:ferredoxin oxidoreductase subunit beta [Treponema sp.]|jgi:2-oxoglutarate ferredoxin oxidoreductase subunit beta|nr:2-oxoacid:ferredoxin oxidoreductase subunit beta [Treponema sp.]
MSDKLQYFRQNRLPHIWCPGCGHGTVTNALVRAAAKIGLDKNKTVVVSGIGCSSRAPGYLDFDTLHTAHGRALAFATGVKHANPYLKVIVMTGDGDCAAIGGNHFIHAARRNIDITTIVMNNNIYGMTSGQYSPMTPKNMLGTTAPYGNVEPAFDLAKLSIAAGASYVARATAYHVQVLGEIIEKALLHKGFSVVEALTPCPTYFGRKNKVGSAVDMLDWYRERAVNVKAAAIMTPDKLEGKFMIGELHCETAPEFTVEYAKLVESVKRKFDNFKGKGGEQGCEQNSD